MSDAAPCRKCGAELEAGALFCSRCGQDMTLLGDQASTLAMTTAGTPVVPVRSTMRQALRDATLGEYEILSELGRGGMATVFLAHDIALDRKVAIKVMAPHLLEGEGMAERFKLEARTAAQLSHPHIIPIYAVKETAETLYFVMKFVEGRGLDEVIKKTGALPIPMVKDILTKVGGALGYAHRRDVVHRDIKPGNIMIDEEGTPVVTDFGIAKVATNTGLTQTGTTIGTPTYMSPEQCQAKAVTGASDQYSLGIVAFEMLTGRVPFEGDSAVTTMYKHCHEELPPLDDFRPDCPSDLRETITRMVAKDPTERWPSLEAAVRKLSNDPTPTSLDPIRHHLMELVREGDTDQLLAQLSNPSGPVARATGRGGGVAAPPGRSRTGLLAAVGVVAVVGVGVAITRPWAPDAPTPVVETGSAGTATGGQTAPTGGPGVTPESGGGTPATGASGGGAGVETPEPAPAATRGGAVSAPAAGPRTPAGPTVASVQIIGAPASLRPGGSATLTGMAVDAGGIVVPGTAVRWSSDNTAVARIDGGGVVMAVAPGQAVLTASAGSRSTSFTLSVAEASVASIVLASTAVELTVDDQTVVGAALRDANGTDLTGRQMTWRSNDEAVVRVNSVGQLTAVGPGTATITATSEGVSTSAGVTVRLATRDAVDGLVAAYARALESRDVAQVRSVYPGITAERATQLQNAFPAMEGLTVEYAIDSVQEQGATATAGVSATYRFRAGGRAQTQAVPLVFTLARTATGWQLSSIR